MAESRYLKLRLFMEGIEVDIVSATVQCGINMPATATIQIPAISRGLEFLPRTLIHLFFLDLGFNSAAIAGIARHALRSERVDIADLRSWKLLFAGEALAFSYVNVGGARHVQLQCQDFSSYWSAAKLYWGKTRGTSVQSFKRAIFAGASQLHKKKDSKKDPIINILSREPSTIPGLQGLLGGIVSLLETATGVYNAPAANARTGKAAKNFRGTNDFMSQAELRLRLTSMIGASPLDDSSAVFIKSSSFNRYFRKISGAVKSTASFMQLTEVLLDRIHHRWASVLAPSYIAKGATVKTKVLRVKDRVNFKGNSDISRLNAAAREAHKVVAKRLLDRLRKTRSEEPLAGSVDYVLNHQIGTDTLVPDVAGHTTFQVGIDASNLLDFEREGKTGEKSLEALNQAAKTATLGKGRAATRRQLNTAAGVALIARAIELLKDVKAVPQDPHRGHTLRVLREVLQLLENGFNQLNPISSASYVTVDKEVELGDRLNMFLFHPDIYMVPPPKCNVLFPDHYSSIRYSRNWLSEVTRMWMFGRTESGKDKKDVYFSPNVSMIGVPGVETAVDAVKQGASFVMQHEKFVGIIPTFQGLGDNDIFKKLHKKEVKENSSRTSDGKGVGGRAQHSPQEHLQRAANFLFFAKRYSPRSMLIQGRFMPQLVAGLPALVLDPDMKAYNEPISYAQVSGTHFIGTIGMLRHDINAQGGASTTVTLVKCRTHTEGLDLFGDAQAGELTKKVRRTRTRKLKPRDGGDFTVKSKGAYTSGFARTDHINKNTVEGFTPKRGGRYSFRVKDSRAGTDVSIEKRFATADGHTEIDDLSLPSIPGAPEQNKLLLVEIIETATVTSVKNITFSLEDTLTPPWFSSIYRRTRIGSDYYQPLIGCFSVLDDAPIELPEKDKKARVLLEEQERLQAIREGFPTPSPAIETVTIPIKAADGSVISEVKLPAELTEVSGTTREAAEVLARVWLSLRQAEANVDLFIESYVARTYASLQDIMGTSNPFLSFRLPGGRAPRSNDGVVGFHGNAYGNYSDLEDVLGEKLSAGSLQEGINERGKPKEIAPSIDPRAERRARVLAYINELYRRSTASSGSGLLGRRE